MPAHTGRPLILCMFLLACVFALLPGCGDARAEADSEASPAELASALDEAPPTDADLKPAATARNAAPPAAPRTSPADPSQTVTIIVEDVPTAVQRAQVQQELTRIAQGKPVAATGYQNRTATFTVGLVVDTAAFANLITFGEVRSINHATRTITVRYNQ